MDELKQLREEKIQLLQELKWEKLKEIDELTEKLYPLLKEYRILIEQIRKEKKGLKDENL